MNKAVTIICPTRNEQDGIQALVFAIRKIRRLALEKFGPSLSLHFILVDNASTDLTVELAVKKLRNDQNIMIVRHIRNLGLQNSILTGLMFTKTDASVVLQSDLQDPPELVILMIEKWMAGSKYIVTKIRKRNSSFFDALSRSVGYWLLNVVAGVRIIGNGGDFWLIDRDVIDQVTSAAGIRPFFRTLIPKFRAPDEVIIYDRLPRVDGKSNFNILGKYEFFIDALLSDPRRIFLSSILISIGLFTYGILCAFLTWTSLPVIIPIACLILASAFTIFLLGLILEFIWRIYTEGTRAFQTLSNDVTLVREN